MRYDSLAELPAAGPRSVVCIGVFDGVHRGHRAILGPRSGLADQSGARVVAVTFDPHPSAVVRPDTQPLMLSTVAHRVSLLTEAGCRRRPRAALHHRRRLVDSRGVRRPGPGRRDCAPRRWWSARGSGSATAPRVTSRCCRSSAPSTTSRSVPLSLEHGAVVEHGDAGEVAWSSTYVRQCVLEGDVAEAARALHATAPRRGCRGARRPPGRELGYPTANLATGRPRRGPGGRCLRRVAGARRRRRRRGAAAGRHLDRDEPDLRRRGAARRGVRARPRPTSTSTASTSRSTSSSASDRP